jgi:hypothetical protein
MARCSGRLKAPSSQRTAQKMPPTAARNRNVQGYAQACAFAGFDLERNTALSLMS